MGKAGAGYSVSPSVAAGQPRTGCTAASRPPRTEGWCWSVSARGTAWRDDQRVDRALEVCSTLEPSPHPHLLQTTPLQHAPPLATQVPAAVSAVNDGVIGRVHRAEVVLSLFHDAAALTRLGAALGFCRVCGAQTPQPRPQTMARCPPQLGSALSSTLPVMRASIFTLDSDLGLSLPSPTYLPGTSCGR